MRRARADRPSMMPRCGGNVQTLVCQQPKSQGRWTVRTLAREVGLPHSTVQAILNAPELQLHRIGLSPSAPIPNLR